MLLDMFPRGVWKFGFLLQNSPNAISTLHNRCLTYQTDKNLVIAASWNESGSYAVDGCHKRQADSSCEMNSHVLLTWHGMCVNFYALLHILCQTVYGKKHIIPTFKQLSSLQAIGELMTI